MGLKLTIKEDLGSDYMDRVPRLRQVAFEALEQRKKMGLPRVYRNELCLKPSHFIHEYPDGSILLIDHNVLNMENTVIRKIK